MEDWRRIWRDGFAPYFSEAGLRALKTALETNDETLIQEATCLPFSDGHSDGPVQCACAIGYAEWKGSGLKLAWEVDEAFANATDYVAEKLQDPFAPDEFITWFDSNPREEVFKELLPEVELALNGPRKTVA